MALDSNAIWDALMERVKTGTGSFTRISRRRRDWGLEEFPVLMVLDDSGDEVRISDPGDPAPAWRLTGELVILARNNDTESIDGTFPADLNDLKQEVMAALERADTDPVGGGMSYYTDLGGLLSTLSVARIEKGIGDRAGTAVVRISLELETNPP